MNSYNKDWSLGDASRLLKRLLDALDDDLNVVYDYISKIKTTLDEKKDDVDFTRLQAFYLLSMCLSKPHQLIFDHQMKTLKDTKRCPYFDEPFDAKTRKNLIDTQKKFLTGTDKLLTYGELSNKQKGLVKLYASKGFQSDKPKQDPRKPTKKPSTKVENKPKQATNKSKEQPQSPKKKHRRTKISNKDKQAVVEAFEKQKE